MADINPTMPSVGEANSTADASVLAALQSIVATINDLSEANLASSAVTTTKIADASVTDSKLAAMKSCRVTKSGNQSLTTDTWTAVAWDTENHDTAAMHDTVTNNSRITAPTAGVYLVGAVLSIAASADANPRGLRIRKDGATTVGEALVYNSDPVGGAANTTINLVTMLEIGATEYVEVMAYQKSGGALDALASGAHFFAIRLASS